jgi:Glucodextranase, domain B/PASTA domain
MLDRMDGAARTERRPPARPVAVRLLAPFAAVLAATSIAACGGGDADPPPSPVRVSVGTPGDEAVVDRSRVQLTGTVTPASAEVMVAGRRATVSGGTFRATVALAPGTNVIDVLASAGRARPALVAIRVRREVSVRVPDLLGASADAARAQLGALGLQAEVEDDGGILDRLLPGDPSVCATDPRAGERLQAGATVRVLVARRC